MCPLQMPRNTSSSSNTHCVCFTFCTSFQYKLSFNHRNTMVLKYTKIHYSRYPVNKDYVYNGETCKCSKLVNSPAVPTPTTRCLAPGGLELIQRVTNQNQTIQYVRQLPNRRRFQRSLTADRLDLNNAVWSVEYTDTHNGCWHCCRWQKHHIWTF